KRPMRADTQKVVIVFPTITLILVTSHHAEVLRRKNLDAAFDVKEAVVMEGYPAEGIEDVYFLRRVVIKIINHSRSEFFNLALGLSRSACGGPGDIETRRDHAHVDHRANANFVVAPAVRVHTLKNRLPQVSFHRGIRHICLAAEGKSASEYARPI